MLTSPRILALWARLSPLPGGRWLFSRILGRLVPYTGSLRAVIIDLEAGYARIHMRERRALRNHLGSLHALALANLGELASGLAMTTALPPDIRGIVTGLEASYVKKARGTIVAEARPHVPHVGSPMDVDVEATLTDSSADVVAHVRVRWLLSPREPRAT